jgi:DnaD/phage-associated family protein
MGISFIYGKSAVVLPGSIVAKIDKATKRDIRILFALAENSSLCKAVDEDTAKVASVIGCTEAELMSSISFWRGAGVLETDEDESVPLSETTETPEAQDDQKERKKTAVAKKTALSDELPKYTTVELTGLLEKQQGMAMLIDECQRAVGKVFNTHEINVIIGLHDYLKLDGEYILLLIDYCKKFGKTSLHYIKKCAFTLYDEGITEAPMLVEKIRKAEAISSLEGEIKTLFGMHGRQLTTKEKKFISAWIGDYGYGIDVIKKAYEMTVDTIHEPVPAYANAIIERWHASGLKDLASIEAAQAEELPMNGSFDTDDFFASASKRSFND